MSDLKSIQLNREGKMGEIRFRAWDDRCNDMVYFGLGENHFNTLDIKTNESYTLDIDDCDNIMQYTGLKDRKGVEIYEGDIVKSFNDYYDGCTHLDLICKYNESEWMFSDHPWCEVGSEKCIVIGNIHENPELLEGEG